MRSHQKHYVSGLISRLRDAMFFWIPDASVSEADSTTQRAKMGNGLYSREQSWLWRETSLGVH